MVGEATAQIAEEGAGEPDDCQQQGRSAPNFTSGKARLRGLDGVSVCDHSAT
jgi:hypothetical protein